MTYTYATPEDMQALVQSVISNQNRIPGRYRTGFGAWVDATEEHSLVRQRAQEWAECFDGSFVKGLAFGGVVGCGKTHLGCAVLRRLIERWFFRVRYVSAPALMLDLKRTWSVREESEYDLMDDLLEEQCLFLDDLGAESAEASQIGFVTERILYLLDQIYQRQRTVLLVSTNLSLEELTAKYAPGYSDRIISRLDALVEFAGVFPEIDMREQDRRAGKGASDRIATPNAA